MIILLKELLSLFLLLTVLAISKAEYQSLFYRLSSSPSIGLSFVPEVLSTILLNIVLVLGMFMVTRWFVYKKRILSHVLIHGLLVVPFQLFVILCYVGALLIFRIFTVTLGSTVQLLFYGTFFIVTYYIVMYWVSVSSGLNIQGRNPWYNVVDCFKLPLRQKLEVVTLYTIPLLTLLTFFVSLQFIMYFLITLTAVYFFVRQYIVSKKKSLKQYVRFLGHTYAERVKKVYGKVF